jgi:CheY-like chemotaxis protein
MPVSNQAALSTVEVEEGAPAEVVVEQVKDALEHLYDLPHLNGLPLAHEWARRAGVPPERAGRFLHREITAALETLNPGRSVPLRAPSARPYNLLVLHYVEGRTVQEAARRLGVSRRQAHRDLRQGLSQIAAVLWSQASALLSTAPAAAELTSIDAEMAHLESQSRPVDLGGLAKRALNIVQAQALQHGIQIRASLPASPLVLQVDPVVAEQVFVGAMSRAISQAHPGPLDLTLAGQQGDGHLVLCFYPGSDLENVRVVGPVLAKLVDRLGWMAAEEDEPDGPRTVTLQVVGRGPAVLVIDDNEGLVTLLQRYLQDEGYRVVPALDGEQGLRLAHSLVPDAIVLDVMMPRVHGWEVLQRLHNHPLTASVPVIVCSVFDNPELAYSLGASAFVAKPVGRPDILTALRRLRAV